MKIQEYKATIINKFLIQLIFSFKKRTIGYLYGSIGPKNGISSSRKKPGEHMKN